MATPLENTMTQSSPPIDSSSPVGPVPLPWYRRPGFWGLVFLILLLAYALWLVWLQWSVAQQHKNALALAVHEQQSRNSVWEAEAARLRAALNEDPCLVEQVLRQSPVLPTMPSGTADMAATSAPNTTPDRANSADSSATGTAARNDTTASGPASPPVVAATGIPALLEQATVLVLTESAEGLGMGTGFFIAPGTIMTNHHVVGAQPQRIWVINKATKGIISAKLLVSSDVKGQDYAVLGVSPVPDIRPLSFSAAVQRTDRVSAWGFPNAVTADDPQFQNLLRGKGNTAPEVVYTDGVVSVILGRKPPLIVHTATVSQGNSGGPLINEHGQVVGINTYIRLDDASYRQSSLAIMSADLLAFLDKNRIPYTLASVPPAPDKADPDKASPDKAATDKTATDKAASGNTDPKVTAPQSSTPKD